MSKPNDVEAGRPAGDSGSAIPDIQLMGIYGISSKTANFFLTHSREGYIGATLDTHLLRWLRTKGYDAPKSTPSVKKYPYWEKIFLDLCAELWPNRSIAEVDLQIWKEMRAN
jgi:thermostable 8-oxoguanine DNA glycosylase